MDAGGRRWTEKVRLLAADSGNWVRVGDPNQAIYDTFTNADPRFLRSYLDEEGVTRVVLPESGRSQPASRTTARSVLM